MLLRVKEKAERLQRDAVKLKNVIVIKKNNQKDRGKCKVSSSRLRHFFVSALLKSEKST